MGIIEKIKEIEAEMARTQKNKATGSFVLIILNFSNLTTSKKKFFLLGVFSFLIN